MKKLFKSLWKICWRLAVFFFVSTILVTFLYKFIPVFYTPLMAVRSWEYRSDDKFTTKKDWVSIDEISPNMAQAVIASEDNLFVDHSGFDWNAIEKATEHNKHSKRVRGASTITQQVAKNVFLWPSRSWTRKGLEVYFTFLIETFWSKKRIMEVYLNVIETGKGIYGVEAAAQAYFKKPAKKLTIAESALMAASLPNPLQRNPAKPSAYMQKRQRDIIVLMDRLGKIELEQKK